MRRSRTAEGDAGGASLTDQANKMANSVDTNKQLRKSYNPVNFASVREYDQSRVIGARTLERRPDKSLSAPLHPTLFEKATKKSGS